MRIAGYGHEIDYEVRGDGRAVVCIPGLTVDRQLLVEACEPALDRPGVRRIYLDLPGHGRSSGDVAHASADSLCAALVALVKEAAGPGALLLGYSYGGYLAQGVAAQLGSELGGLFVVSPVLEPDLGRRRVPQKRIARKEPLTFADDVERDAFQEIAVLQTAAQLERFRRVVHPANVATDRAFVAQLRARYVLSQPFAQALSLLSAPVTLVCGRDDHWAGWEDAVPLVRALRDAELAVLPDCGHLLPIEASARLQSLLSDWLARALGSALAPRA